MGIEKSEIATYVLLRVTQDKSITKKYRYYICNRAFGFTSSALKRRSKSGGSIKINATCLSSITVKQVIEDDHLYISVYSTHLGHDCLIGKQFLSNEDRTAIAGNTFAHYHYYSYIIIYYFMFRNTNQENHRRN